MTEKLDKLKKSPKSKFENIITETINNLSFDMIFIKGGAFEMGSKEEKDEKPIHTLIIPNFYIAEYHVTQKLWKEIMENNPSHFENCVECPVGQKEPS